MSSLTARPLVTHRRTSPSTASSSGMKRSLSALSGVMPWAKRSRPSFRHASYLPSYKRRTTPLAQYRSPSLLREAPHMRSPRASRGIISPSPTSCELWHSALMPSASVRSHSATRHLARRSSASSRRCPRGAYVSSTSTSACSTIPVRRSIRHWSTQIS